MEKVTVKELREQAKGLGLKGFWKLRKAELFELIQLAKNKKTELNFIDVDSSPQLQEPTHPKPKRNSQILTRGVPILKPKPVPPPPPVTFRPKRPPPPKAYQLNKKRTKEETKPLLIGFNPPVVVPAKVTQAKIKRRKEKERNIKRRISRSSGRNKKELIRDLSKTQKELEKILPNVPSSKTLLDAEIGQGEIFQQPLQPLKPPAVSKEKIKKDAELGRKKLDDWERWLLTTAEQEPKAVDPALEFFKRYVNSLCSDGGYTMVIEKTASALKDFSHMYNIKEVEGFDPRSFLGSRKKKVVDLFSENRKTKVKIELYCEMSMTSLKTGETVYTHAKFSSYIHEILLGTDVEELYDTMVSHILENLATFQRGGSSWAFESIIDMSIHFDEYVPFRGKSYIPLPPSLKNKKAIINMKNEDDECFKWCIVRALNPSKRIPNV